jgi:hypothetical protein
MWYQDTILLDPTDRRKMESRGNKHTLTIRNVQGSDFGNYSCVADNSLGRAKKYMELSGNTNKPLILYIYLHMSKGTTYFQMVEP